MSWKCSWEIVGSNLANLIKLIALWNNFLARSSVDHQHQTKLTKIVKDGPFKFCGKDEALVSLFVRKLVLRLESNRPYTQPH